MCEVGDEHHIHMVGSESYTCRKASAVTTDVGVAAPCTTNGEDGEDGWSLSGTAAGRLVGVSIPTGGCTEAPALDAPTLDMACFMALTDA